MSGYSDLFQTRGESNRGISLALIYRYIFVINLIKEVVIHANLGEYFYDGNF
jgi:hypothetical protein